MKSRMTSSTAGARGRRLYRFANRAPDESETETRSFSSGDSPGLRAPSTTDEEDRASTYVQQPRERYRYE